MSKPTILCVDDERNILLTLRNQLMQDFPDFMIEIAESAEEAMEVVEDLLGNGIEVPLVIADQIMHSMRGDQFLIELHERYPQILKVMLTGQASAEDVGNIVNRGKLYRFISKPWDKNDLQITVSAALESYAKDRTIQSQYLALEQAKLELETLNADLEKQVQDRTQQLQLSEEHYRILSELSPVGIFRNDANGNCTYANAKTLQITGLTLEENLGNGWGKNIHPDDRGWMYDAWTNFVEQINLGNDAEYCIEHRYLYPDGSTKWGFVQAVPERNINGNVVGFVGAVSDISDRKLAEERQYQSEQKNRAILEAIPDLLLRVRPDGSCIEYIAPKSTAVDFLPIHQHLSEVLPLDILKHELQRIQQARETGELQVWEHKILRHGLECYEEVRVIPCGDEFLAIVQDISDRKKNEEALRLSEAKQRALIEALPDLVMRVSREGIYLDFYATSAFRVIGKTGDFIGTHVRDSLPPDLVKRRMNAIHAALETKEMQIYEQEISVGDNLQIEECRVVACGENEVLIVGRDISDRKLAEIALRQSEERYRILTEVSAVGIFRFDAEGQCVYVNNRWSGMTGRPASVAMGMGWVEAIHPDDIDQLLSDWGKAYESDGYYEGEARYLRPDGSIIWFYAQVIPEVDDNGNIISYIGSLTDISDRKLAEAQVQQSEKQLQLTLDFTGIGAWSWFPSTGEYKWTGKMENLLEIPPDLENMFQIWRDRIHPDDAGRVEASIQQALAIQSTFSEEYRYQLHDDQIVWRLVVGQGIYTETGDLDRVLGIVQDISDRKLAEIDLRKSESHKSALIRALPDLIMRIHKDGTYLEFHSTDSFNVFGKAEDFVGKNLDKDLSPNVVEQRMKMINAALETGDIQIYEQEILVDGKNQTEEVRIVPYTEDEVLLVVRDISDRKQSELALQSLLEGTASVTGQEFFPELVKHIAIALDVSYVFITKLSEENLETIAWYANNQIQPNLTYPMAHTPCGSAFRDGIYNCLSGLKQLFPLDEDLVKMDADNYIGVALQNSADQKIGVICVLNPQPLVNPKRAELLLRIFGARASAELERMQVFEDLQILNIELEQRVLKRTRELEESRNILQLVLDTIPQRVFWKDRESRFIGCNPVFANDAGYSVEYIIGKTDLEMPWAEWADLYRTDDARVMESGIPKLGYEEPLTNLDGDQIWIRTSKIPLTNKQGDLIGIMGCYEDISDRKQAERELSQARNFLEAIIENIPLALFVKNGREEKFGEFLLWNKTSEIMFGLTKKQAIGKSGYDFFPKEQSDFFREKDRSSFALRKIEDIPEEPIDSLTLGRRILHTIKVPIFDEHGNPDYLICISEDISDRKAVESALTASEAQLRSLFAGMDDIVIVLDRMGTYLKIAPTNSDRLYHPSDILLGRKIADFFPPEQTNQFLATIAKTLETQKTQELEYALVIKDIEYLFNAKCSPLNTDSVVWVARDITDRKQTEIALKASEENLRAAFEQASVGMAQANLNGQFVKLNQRYCEILGYTEAELLTSSFEEITHPDDLAMDRENIRKILAGEKKSFFIEKRYIHKDGHIIWANLDVSLVANPHGESANFFGVIQDISDRKQMEKDIATLYEEIWEANSNLEKANKQLAAYSTNLESIVYHRTNELKSAQIQIIAQEKLASLGTLTAGVAHEIRNPLNFVKNYAEGSIELGQDLIDTLEPLMPSIDESTSKLIKSLIADLQENSTAIQRHSDRAEKVINNMMQYTRDDNEKVVTQSSDLNDLIDQSLKLASFSKRMIDTNFYLTIRTNYAANLAMVDLFPSAFGRAIINLVENSCDAMRFKQIKLQSENPTLHYQPTLTISTRPIENLLEIRIKDNGCGIPHDIQSKILDPFFTTKPPGEGTGLGLSLTHDIIVNQHQGTLVIDSQLGEYTEIIITLPYIRNLEKASDT